MRNRILLYKSLRETFEKNGYKDPAIEVKFGGTSGSATIQNGYINLDAHGSDDNYSFLYNKIPIGNVPQINRVDYFGDPYKIQFDFRIAEDFIAGDDICIFSITSDQWIPSPDSWANWSNYVKFQLIAFDAARNGYLFAYALDGDAIYYDNTGTWATAYASTGIAFALNTWYTCTIERKFNRYNVFINAADGTSLLEMTNLYFSDFNVDLDHLRYSNYDTIRWETADYLILGQPDNVGFQSNIHVRNLFISTPIQLIDLDLSDINANNTGMETYPYASLTINNSPGVKDLLNNILLKYADIIQDYDEIEIISSEDLEGLVHGL